MSTGCRTAEPTWCLQEVRSERLGFGGADSGCRLLSLPLTLTLVGFCGTTSARAQWTNIGPEGGYIEALAVNPSRPQTVYAGTYGGGVFRSTNGGASWTPMSSGLAATAVFSLAISPSGANTIYAGTGGGGVFKTTDGRLDNCAIQ